MKTVVLIHGRHLQTRGWEKLIWGDGSIIGAGPLGINIALRKGAQLIFGTGASEKDGLKECEFTKNFLMRSLPHMRFFPEFKDYLDLDVYEWQEKVLPQLGKPHLDFASTDTVSEVKNAITYARENGATELITVTSPFHYARCASVVGKLLEDGFDFGNVVPMVVSGKSSTAECRASTTVILEHPHRGDDPMVNSRLAPHQVFPRMFKLPPKERMEFFRKVALWLTDSGV